VKNYQDLFTFLIKKKIAIKFVFYIVLFREKTDDKTIDIDSDLVHRKKYSLQISFCPSASNAINKVQTHGKNLLVNANVIFSRMSQIRISWQRETALSTRRFEGKSLM